MSNGRHGVTSPPSLPRSPPCADTADVSIALRMVLSMEGVECRLQ
jgi:hypothetical protein